MTEDIATLGLAVESDQVAKATGRNKEFAASADGAERSAKGLETTTALLTRAMGLLGAALSVTQLIRMTSTWTDLNSRIRNSIDAHESAIQVMNRIDEMARRTYSSLEQTAEGYLRNSQALGELGYSTGQTLDFVESLNNALVVSGAKGDRAASVMNALSKAIGLGKLSGEDLNTVLSSGGRVTEALAEGLGISTLELRKFGAEGKLTTDAVVKALISQLETLREEAEAMPGTIEDGFTQINRALTVTVGRLDEYLGASSAVAESMIFVADNADMLVPIIGALAGVIIASLIPALVGATVALAAFAASPIGLLTIGIGALAGAVSYLWNEQRLAAQAASDHEDAIEANSKAIEVARTASQGFRKDLRDQIAMQTEAARAALTEADAQTTAARAKAVASTIDVFGMKFQDPFAQADANASLAKSLALDGALQQLETQLAQIDEIMKTAPGADDAKRVADPTKDQIKAKESYDDLVKSTERRTAALVAEAEAMGLNAVEAKSLVNLHELMAEAEATGVEMTEARIEQITRLSEAMTDAELTLEGLQITMENRTPWEVMGEEIERLNELMDRGKITANDYFTEIGRAAEEMVGSYASGANDVIDNIEKITDAMGLEGKKAFEVQKALGIARAVVSGAESITHSFNAGTAIGGPPVGFAFAAIATAATAAQIAALASTTYQSKSVASSSGGGSTAATPAAAPQTGMHLTLVGGPTAVFQQSSIQSLIEQINDHYSLQGKEITLGYKNG